jgi:hypothetical protein
MWFSVANRAVNQLMAQPFTLKTVLDVQNLCYARNHHSGKFFSTRCLEMLTADSKSATHVYTVSILLHKCLTLNAQNRSEVLDTVALALFLV